MNKGSGIFILVLQYILPNSNLQPARAENTRFENTRKYPTPKIPYFSRACGGLCKCVYYCNENDRAKGSPNMKVPSESWFLFRYSDA